MNDEKLPDTLLIVSDGNMIVLITGGDENGMDHRVCILKEDVDIVCLWMKQKALECKKVQS